MGEYPLHWVYISIGNNILWRWRACLRKDTSHGIKAKVKAKAKLKPSQSRDVAKARGEPNIWMVHTMAIEFDSSGEAELWYNRLNDYQRGILKQRYDDWNKGAVARGSALANTSMGNALYNGVVSPEGLGSTPPVYLSVIDQARLLGTTPEAIARQTEIAELKTKLTAAEQRAVQTQLTLEAKMAAKAAEAQRMSKVADDYHNDVITLQRKLKEEEADDAALIQRYQAAEAKALAKAAESQQQSGLMAQLQGQLDRAGAEIDKLKKRLAAEGVTEEEIALRRHFTDTMLIGGSISREIGEVAGQIAYGLSQLSETDRKNIIAQLMTSYLSKEAAAEIAGQHDLSRGEQKQIQRIFKKTTGKAYQKGKKTTPMSASEIPRAGSSSKKGSRMLAEIDVNLWKAAGYIIHKTSKGKPYVLWSGK